MDYPKVIAVKCIGCGACVDLCPVIAISMENHIAHINEEQCRNCQACVQMCLGQAISV